jgi:nitrate reductase NapA
MDMAIDKCKLLSDKLGLDTKKVVPYERRTEGPFAGSYDPEEVFEDIVVASKGSDADLTGMLAVKERDGIGLYEQLRRARGIQWPAGTYEIAKKGGTPRRYMGQEGWKEAPYALFPKQGGKAKFKLCEQDYGENGALIKEVTSELSKYGAKPGEGPWLHENIELLERARDNALTPELPDLEFYRDREKSLADAKKEEKFPFWLGLGIVYEHFHTAKTIRGPSTLRLVPEQYLEMSVEDAERYGLEDGERVRIVSRRGSYEGRLSVGTTSMVRPARTEVFPGYVFSPWNLSVADSADPKKNRWLVNAVAHRAWDPVSGQADYKKIAARIERI